LVLEVVLHPLMIIVPFAAGPTYVLGPPATPWKTLEDEEAGEADDAAEEESELAVDADAAAVEEASETMAEACAGEMVSVLVSTELLALLSVAVAVAVADAALALLPSVPSQPSQPSELPVEVEVAALAVLLLESPQLLHSPELSELSVLVLLPLALEDLEVMPTVSLNTCD